MDVHSVHNASCLYVHIWAQERGKEVNYACRCRVAQSTAKHLFSDFQTENTTHEFDMAKNHCRRDLQTEGWTHQQKTSLTKLGNKKLSSSATPSCIISQCLCNRISTASDDADDAVACSIRTDIPVSKWNSDHKTSTNVTGAWLTDIVTMQFSRSHGQPLQKPREVQEMFKIPVCQSSLVSRTFSVHIRIWMFTLCTMHLVSTFTSEPRKEVKR